MSEPENVNVELLCNNSLQCFCPFNCPNGLGNPIPSLTSNQTFCTGTIKPKHGVRIIINVNSVSGTSPTLSISASLGNYEPSLSIVSNISSTGTWVIHIAEDGTVTLNANGTLSTIGKISMPADTICLSFTVGGTSPSFDISAWVEYD